MLYPEHLAPGERENPPRMYCPECYSENVIFFGKWLHEKGRCQYCEYEADEDDFYHEQIRPGFF